MKTKLLHTPEGVRDIYGCEYSQKVMLQENLLKAFHLYGYEDIQTPTFEFFDIFSSKIGTIPSKELYKFFDKEGNTLVLRPDFTPSIARCAAKYFMDETMPIRFCYSGSTFINTSDFQGRLKEMTQIGVELINDDSVYADAEMIALMIQSMKGIGISEFQVTIGNVEFFKGLCEECGIDSEVEMELRDHISNKNYFGAEQILDAAGVSDDVKSKLLKVTEMFGSIDSVLSAREIVNNERSLKAIDRIARIHELLTDHGLSEYLTYDCGMLSKYHYYTGVIFRAYTYGSGDAVMKGGRYDGLLSEFGKNAPAIGFAALSDELYMTGRRLGILNVNPVETTLILYDENKQSEAVALANQYRNEGKRTVMLHMDLNQKEEDYEEYAQKRGYTLVKLS